MTAFGVVQGVGRGILLNDYFECPGTLLLNKNNCG